MKKTLGTLAAVIALGFATQAGAADLPVKVPVKAPPLAPVFSWTGFYIGAHVGGGWSDKSWCRVGALANGCVDQVAGVDFAQVDPDGIIGGVQAGYNWQINQFVLGIEGDFSFSGMDGSAPFRTSYTAHTDVNDLATIAGRFGVAFDRALIYGKGGVAWVNEDHWVSNPAASYGKTNSTRTGWMVGVGLEYAFLGNWSGKIEYNFLDFGSDDVTIERAGGLFGGTGPVTIDQQIHLVKAGINYRFGGF